MNTLYRDISLTLDKESYKKIAFFELKVNNDLVKSKSYDVKGIYFRKGNIKFANFLLKSLGYTKHSYKVYRGSVYTYFEMLKDDLKFDKNDLVFVRIEQELVFK